MSRPINVGKIIAESLGGKTFSVEPTSPDPGPKWVTCRVCDTEFKSNSHWLAYKWWYASICAPCDDKVAGINHDKPDAPVKTFRCISCKKLLTQKGFWKKGAWYYEMTCPQCGLEQSCYDKPISLEPPTKKPKTPYKDDE